MGIQQFHRGLEGRAQGEWRLVMHVFAQLRSGALAVDGDDWGRAKPLGWSSW